MQETILLHEPHAVYWQFVDSHLARRGLTHSQCTAECFRNQGSQATARGHTHGPTTRVLADRRRLPGVVEDAIGNHVRAVLAQSRPLLVPLWQQYTSLAKALNWTSPQYALGHNALPSPQARGTARVSDAQLAHLHWLGRIAPLLGIRLRIVTIVNDEDLATRVRTQDPGLFTRLLNTPEEHLTAVTDSPTIPPSLTRSQCAQHPLQELTYFIYQQNTYALMPRHSPGGQQDKGEDTPAHVPLPQIVSLSWMPASDPATSGTLYLHDPARARMAAVGSASRLALSKQARHRLVNLHVLAINAMRIANTVATEAIFTLRYTPKSQRRPVPSISRGDNRDPERYVVLCSDEMTEGPLEYPLALARTRPPLSDGQSATDTDVALTFTYHVHRHYAESGLEIAHLYIAELDDCTLPPMAQLLKMCKSCQLGESGCEDE